MSAPRAAAPPPVAAIDIGTNSVLLTVARTDGLGALEIALQRATVTRLGQGVDQTGRLHPEAEARTLECLCSYRKEMDTWGVRQARAVGTSALRDAQGGDSFLDRASDVLGFRPEVISGQREAELTLVGALSGLPPLERVFVFDIGGGSTELIVGASPAEDGALRIEQCVSLNIGSVRLTERHQLEDPPNPTQLVGVRQNVREMLSGSGVTVAPGTAVVGVAGTVTTLAALSKNMASYDPELIHGASLGQSAITDLAKHLAQMTHAELCELPGLSKGRADVIVAGAILCDEILKMTESPSLIVSDRGVRFGLLAELTSNS